MTTDTTTTASRDAHARVGAAGGATFLALLVLGLLNAAADADLLHQISVAVLPVAIGLVALALAAWGALAAQLDDADTVRLARTYLEPLSTWALVAIGGHALALLAAGEATGLSIALALALAAGAVALRIAPAPPQPMTATATPPPAPSRPRAPEPDPAPAPLPAGPVAPADGPLWAGPREARRSRASTALWHG